MSARLFHLAPAEAFEHWLAKEPSDWAPSSVAREGFVHLSFAHQLPGTLTAHFAAERQLVLVEVEAAAVDAELRVERSRANALFPHLYRPLRRADLLRTWSVAREDEGWTLPRLGAEASADRPPGRTPK